MWGTTVIIRTTRFYEGYTRECEWGESDGVELELKLHDDLHNWLRRNGNRDGWHFEKVAEPFEHHWYAYDKAKAGQPVALEFWFGDKAIAALAKLMWDGV